MGVVIKIECDLSCACSPQYALFQNPAYGPDCIYVKTKYIGKVIRVLALQLIQLSIDRSRRANFMHAVNVNSGRSKPPRQIIACFSNRPSLDHRAVASKMRKGEVTYVRNWTIIRIRVRDACSTMCKIHCKTLINRFTYHQLSPKYSAPIENLVRLRNRTCRVLGPAT